MHGPFGHVGKPCSVPRRRSSHAAADGFETFSIVPSRPRRGGAGQVISAAARADLLFFPSPLFVFFFFFLFF